MGVSRAVPRRALLLGFLAVVPAVALAGPRFVDKEGGWSFEPPTGWRMEKPGEGQPNALHWFGPTKEDYTLNIRVRGAQYSGASIAPLIADGKKSYARDPDVTKIIGDKKVTVAGGGQGWTITVQRKMPNGLLLEQRQFVTIKTGRAIIITGSAPVATAAQDGPIFDKVRTSFRWDR
jgi:hypothetical protein